MHEILIAWPADEDNEWNNAIKTEPRLAKMALLYSQSHLRPEGFLKRLLEPWECDKDYNEMPDEKAAAHCLRYALECRFSHSHFDNDINAFLAEYWKYIRPENPEKVTLIFNPGEYETRQVI